MCTAHLASWLWWDEFNQLRPPLSPVLSSIHPSILSSIGKGCIYIRHAVAAALQANCSKVDLHPGLCCERTPNGIAAHSELMEFVTHKGGRIFFNSGSAVCSKPFHSNASIKVALLNGVKRIFCAITKSTPHGGGIIIMMNTQKHVASFTFVWIHVKSRAMQEQSKRGYFVRAN